VRTENKTSSLILQHGKGVDLKVDRGGKGRPPLRCIVVKIPSEEKKKEAGLQTPLFASLSRRHREKGGEKVPCARGPEVETASSQRKTGGGGLGCNSSSEMQANKKNEKRGAFAGIRRRCRHPGLKVATVGGGRKLLEEEKSQCEKNADDSSTEKKNIERLLHRFSDW